MRIALVNQPWGHIVPPVVTGGSIPLILYELAQRLTTSAEVIYYTRGRYRKYEIADGGIRFRYLPVAPDKLLLKALERLGRFPNPRAPMFASSWSYLGYAVQLAMDVQRERCDLVHIVNMSQFVPVVRHFNPDAKIVLHMECEWLNQLDEPMIRQRIEQCDRVIGCSRFITGKAQQRFPDLAEQCATVYNGVDTRRFHPTGAKESRDRDALRILFVGRVAPTKGVHVLLEAFARIAAAFPSTYLEIVGPEEINSPDLEVPFADDPKVTDLLPLYAEGRPLRALLDRLATPWGDRVQFLGNLPQDDSLVSRYQSADVCVIPSVWEEPFGIPVIEAMACGVPVIATHGGAFPEIVEHGRTGLLVERGNATELADALAELLSDRQRRESMGRAGRERVLELFDWDRTAQEFGRHYETLAARPAAPIRREPALRRQQT